MERSRVARLAEDRLAKQMASILVMSTPRPYTEFVKARQQIAVRMQYMDIATLYGPETVKRLDIITEARDQLSSVLAKMDECIKGAAGEDNVDNIEASKKRCWRKLLAIDIFRSVHGTEVLTCQQSLLKRCEQLKNEADRVQKEPNSHHLLKTVGLDAGLFLALFC